MLRVKEPPLPTLGTKGRGVGQGDCVSAHSPGSLAQLSGPSTWQDLRKPVLVEQVQLLPGAPPEQACGPFTSSLPVLLHPLAWQRAPARAEATVTGSLSWHEVTDSHVARDGSLVQTKHLHIRRLQALLQRLPQPPLSPCTPFILLSLCLGRVPASALLLFATRLSSMRANPDLLF